jgi:hypothetical protein
LNGAKLILSARSVQRLSARKASPAVKQKTLNCPDAAFNLLTNQREYLLAHLSNVYLSCIMLQEKLALLITAHEYRRQFIHSIPKQ